MRVRFLDSVDVETFSEALASAAKSARELDVAAAFLTTAGAEQILNLSRRLVSPKSRKQVRVLVGTWRGVTEPSALARLQKEKMVKLRVSRTPGFHIKHAALRGDSKIVTFTGSANFTAKGLGGAGELVAEVTDDARSSFASTERDAFRRLWEQGYSDDLTDEVIEAYAKMSRPKWSRVKEEGSSYGKGLLKRFGRRSAKQSGVDDDGSVLWTIIGGTFSTATQSALELEARDQKAPDFIGLASKKWFERIKKGTRHAWVLDVRGNPSERNLKFHKIVREIEMPTDSDGRYFAILRPPEKRIKVGPSKVGKGHREELKQLGLVDRIDSLSGNNHILSKREVAALLKIS